MHFWRFLKPSSASYKFFIVRAVNHYPNDDDFAVKECLDAANSGVFVFFSS